MTIGELSKNQTTAIKGVAILSIALHNYFHQVLHIGENEFSFCSNRVFSFFNTITSQPIDIIGTIFSFLGHYGVQAFILISGYGLAKSMQKHRRDWLSFVANRLTKLYPLLLTGIIVFVGKTLLCQHRLINDTELTSIEHKLLFIHTLLPYDALSLIGPWWFFGLIFQLYLLFPFLFKLIEKYNTIGFAIITTASFLLIFAELYGLTSSDFVTMLQNAPGHLPEFALGIWLALSPDKKISETFGLLTIALFILGNFFKAFFPFTFISAAFIMYWIASKSKHDNNGKGFIHFIGGLSMIIFVTNGIIRDHVIHWVTTNNTAASRYIFSLLFIALTIPVSYIGKYIYESLVWLFNHALRKIAEIHLVKKCRKCISIIALPSTILILTVFYLSFNEQHIDEMDYSLGKTEITILPEDIYTSLSKNLVLDKNYVKLDIDIEFDILEHSEQLPVVVFEVGKLLWEKSEIKPDGKCTIHKKLIISNRTKKEKLKTYIWNPNKSRLRINNLKVYINGTSTL